jgi:hypothetical protein
MQEPQVFVLADHALDRVVSEIQPSGRCGHTTPRG